MLVRCVVKERRPPAGPYGDARCDPRNIQTRLELKLNLFIHLPVTLTLTLTLAEP